MHQRDVHAVLHPHAPVELWRSSTVGATMDNEETLQSAQVKQKASLTI